MSFGDKNFTYGPRIVKDGLVFYMDAANPSCYISGNTTCNDLVSSSVGTLENDTLFSTLNNGIWEFDGSDDSIRTPDKESLRMTSEITIICWFKKATKDGYHHLVSKYPTSTNCSWGLATEITSGNLMFQGSSSGNDNGQYAEVPTDVCTGNWTFGAVSYIVSDNEVNIYVNDTRTTVSYSNGLYPGDVYLAIAERPLVGQYWPGNVAIAQVYNRALSQIEITRNYNSLKGRFGL